MIHSAREFWAVLHGMVLGSIFLLSFSGVLVGLYGFRPDWLTPQGVRHRIRLLKIGTIAMAIASWLTVITGTYIVYPWYRAKAPEGVANLLRGCSGRSLPKRPRSYSRAAV